MGPGEEIERLYHRSRLRRALPDTALGLAGVLFLMSVAAAFSGAVLYAYYESRQEKTTNSVEQFFHDYNKSIDDARKTIEAEGASAKADIRNQLDELQKFAASGQTLTALLQKEQPSVYFVSTLDQAGAPSVGSAFVVFADSQQSFLLTSYTTVQAATQQPAPKITLRKQGQDDIDATLFTWDPGHDLALLTIQRANLPALNWIADNAPPKIGDRLFGISGLGSTGASITQGFVADVSADGVQHDVPVGSQFQGGPLVNTDGDVVAVASRTYSPLGFNPQTVFFAPLVRAACNTVLQCPSGTPKPSS
ncbi:MAG TPA: serine protease [Acidimicrobiales bacterium]|jgi:S1-C subfamily serine protease|nr:serine protease [Acidimicrobiales bacterium]